MRRLLLTTVSVIALGFGGIGVAAAQSHSTSRMGTAARASSMHRTGTAIGSSSMRNVSAATVKKVQRKLRADNLYRGHIDGIIGNQTRTALRRYQKKHDLRVTATLDQRTMQHLLGRSAVGQGTSQTPTRMHNGRMGQGTSLAPRRTGTQAGQGSATPPSGRQSTRLGAGQGASMPPSQQAEPSNLGAGQPTSPGNNTQTNSKY